MKVDNCSSVNKIMTFSLGTAEKTLGVRNHHRFTVDVDSSLRWFVPLDSALRGTRRAEHDSVMVVKADVMRATLEFGRDSEREFGRRLFACLSRLGRGRGGGRGKTMSSTADALSWLIARREPPPKEERPITTTTSTSSRPSIAPFF